MKNVVGVGLMALLLLFTCAEVLTGAEPDLSAGLVGGAKKEGKLNLYTNMGIDHSQPLLDRFQKKYPFIQASLFRLGGTVLLEKIVTETRVGRHLFDVVLGRGEHVPQLKGRGLIAPYKSPERERLKEGMTDKESYWSVVFLNTYVLAYNTMLLKREELPKSYQDLLHPNWKGKISMDNENYEWFSGLLDEWGKHKGLEYMRRLAAQEMRFGRGPNLRLQLMAAGEMPLGVVYGPRAQVFKTKGAPIDWVPLEPVIVQLNPIMLAARAPNPNAAKLFIDFVLSKEGQEMIRDFNRIGPREDVSPNPPALFQGFRYRVIDPDSYENFPQIVKLYREVFGLR